MEPPHPWPPQRALQLIAETNFVHLTRNFKADSGPAPNESARPAPSSHLARALPAARGQAGRARQVPPSGQIFGRALAINQSSPLVLHFKLAGRPPSARAHFRPTCFEFLWPFIIWPPAKLWRRPDIDQAARGGNLGPLSGASSRPGCGSECEFRHAKPLARWAASGRPTCALSCSGALQLELAGSLAS